MTNTMNRRRFLAAGSAGLATAGLSARGLGASDAHEQEGHFQHGVASGDPLPDGIILWTRVSPAKREDSAVDVEWVLATDPALEMVVARGQVQTHAIRDYTVNVDVRGLEPGRRYYYQFRSAGQRSSVGRTRTAPLGGPDAVAFAVTSCANYSLGYFNVYRRIAERNELDAVIQLGDYLYEYPARRREDELDLRRHVPAEEIIRLADYRMRYAQYRSDPDLQAAHEAHPWICVWDDHESANNSWMHGAQNHSPEEGDWALRKAAAIQAYHEWMPIRSQTMTVAVPRIFRGFRFGDTVDLLMLDTRLYGRSEQAVPGDAAGLADPSRSILGAEQRAWLQTQLTASAGREVHWRVLGNQCMFGQLLGEGGAVLNPDQWDGYPLDQRAIISHLRDGGIGNNVILTGDLHSSWALDIHSNPFGDDYAKGQGNVAVELVTSSVTSRSRFNDPVEARPQEQQIVAGMPHMKWLNLSERGYLITTLTQAEMRAEWWLVDTVGSRQHEQRLAAAYVSESGSNRLTAA
ncbi:MAG: alkaline phosphatase D family protein [Pseudomonadota bacterium]